MNTSGQRTCIYVVALAIAFLSFGRTSQAEDIEITHCYSGAFVQFNKTEGTSPLLSWAQNGIIMSAHPKKLLQNAVIHCEGIQIGLGQSRSLHGFCKIMDDDGDVILAELPWPHKGIDFEVKFLEGTGKWKGITGQLHSKPIARSQPNKGAMPDTYQTCRLEKGQFEVAK
jgi:hypothetical protein